MVFCGYGGAMVDALTVEDADADAEAAPQT